MNAKPEMQKEITPNNILLIGATGVGKTEIARRLALVAHAPFVKVEASKFTEVGYVGRDVESMVRDLVEASVKMVKQEKRAGLKEQALLIAEETILEELIPTVTHPVSTQDAALNEATRENMMKKLQAGELDERKIELVVPANPNFGIGMMAPPNMDDSSMMNIKDMFEDLMPKKNKKRKVTIAEARKILVDLEIQRLMDMDEVKTEAIKRAEDGGIIFIDEIDKIVSNHSGAGASGAAISREGVQRDLLPIVEGSTVNTKYGTINTDHVLFIAAGAFHLAKPSDLIPELQGRFPIRVELSSLEKDDFVRILNEPQNSLIKQYQALFQAENVELSFTDDAIIALAEKAAVLNAEMENIGARRLQTVLSQLLNEFLFEVPDTIPAFSKLIVGKEMVEEKLNSLVANQDLSRYIL